MGWIINATKGKLSLTFDKFKTECCQIQQALPVRIKNSFKPLSQIQSQDNSAEVPIQQQGWKTWFQSHSCCIRLTSDKGQQRKIDMRKLTVKTSYLAKKHFSIVFLIS